MSKSLRLPREKHFQPQKLVRDPGVLTILTSKSCWRASVVQILPTATSKSAPTPSVFNDFDFQIVLARRRGANFADFNFQKCSDHASFERFWLPNRCRAQAWCKFWRLQLPKVLRTCQFLTILTSESLSRAGVVQILPTSTSKIAPRVSLTILTSRTFSRAGVVQILSHLKPQILRTRPFLGPDFSSRRSHKTMVKHSISRISYPPNPHVAHLCCITSARSHLLIDRSSAATFSIVGSWIPKLPLIISYHYQIPLRCLYLYWKIAAFHVQPNIYDAVLLYGGTSWYHMELTCIYKTILKSVKSAAFSGMYLALN